MTTLKLRRLGASFAVLVLLMPPLLGEWSTTAQGAPLDDGLQVTSLGDILPQGMTLPATIWDGRHVYLFGPGGTNDLSTIHRFDPADLSVKLMPGRLPAGVGASAVWTGEFAYVFGGHTASGGVSDAITRFDPGTGEAMPMKAKLPTARYRTVAVWDGQAAYILGGTRVPGCFVCPALDEIVRFDPASDRTELLDVRLPLPRFAPALVWTGKTAYLLGGVDGSGFRADILAFSPASGDSRILPARLPDVRAHASGLFDGKLGYVVGGFNRPANGADLADAIEFDPRTETLRTIPGIPLRHDAGAIWAGSVGYVFGGYRFEPLRDVIRLTSVERTPVLASATPTRGAIPGENVRFEFLLRNPSANLVDGTLRTSSPWPLVEDPADGYHLTPGLEVRLAIVAAVPGNAVPGSTATIEVSFSAGNLRAETLRLRAHVNRDALLVLPAARIDPQAGLAMLSARVADTRTGELAVLGSVSVGFRVSSGSTELFDAMCHAVGPATLTASDCYDPASGEYRLTAPTAGWPTSELLELFVVAIDVRTGAVGTQRATFVIPGQAPVVFGRVVDTAGAPKADMTVVLTHDHGSYFKGGAPVLRSARTDFDGRYLIDTAPVAPGERCLLCRVKVLDGESDVPLIESPPLGIPPTAVAVERDLLFGNDVTTLFGTPVSRLFEDLNRVLKSDTIDMNLRIHNQGVLVDLAKEQDDTFAVVDNFADQTELILGVMGLVHKGGKLAIEIGADGPQYALALKVAEEQSEAAGELAGFLVDDMASREVDAGFGAVDAYRADLLDRYRSLLLTEFERESGYILRGEPLEVLKRVVEGAKASVPIVLAAPYDVAIIEASPLPRERDDRMLRTLSMLDESGRFLPDGDLDRGALYNALMERLTMVQSYGTDQDPGGVTIALLPWLNGKSTMDLGVPLGVKQEVVAYDQLVSNLPALMDRQVVGHSILTGAGIGLAAGVFLVGLCATGVGCVLSAGALVAMAVLPAAGSAAVLLGKGAVERKDDWLLLEAQRRVFQMANRWVEENAYAPVLLKSAADTVIQEAERPDLFSRSRTSLLEWLDASGQPSLSPRPQVDLPVRVQARAHGVVQGVHFGSIPVVNLAWKIQQDGERASVSMDGTITTTTSYQNYQNRDGDDGFGTCWKASVKRLPPIQMRFHLTPDTSLSRPQEIPLVFRTLARTSSPCGPVESVNENRVQYEVRYGNGNVVIGEFTVQPELDFCGDACPTGTAASSLSAHATEPTQTPALLEASLTPATPRASVRYIVPEGAREVRLHATSPSATEIALTVRDDRGRRAGYLADTRAEGTEFPAELQRSAANDLAITLPAAPGRSFEIEAVLLSSTLAATPVRVDAFVAERTLGSLGATAPGEVYVGPAQRTAALEVRVAENGGSEPLRNVRVRLDLPALSDHRLLAQSPLTTDLGTLVPGQLDRVVFGVADRTGTMPEGRYAGTIYVSGQRLDGTPLTIDLPVQLVVDRTAPNVAAFAPGGAIAPGGRIVVAPEHEVALAATDALSGLDGVYYRVDDSLERAYEAPFRIGGADGPRTVHAIAVDRAGNQAAPSFPFALDTTSPAVRFVTLRPGSLTVDGTRVDGDADRDAFPDVAELTVGVDPDNAVSTPLTYDVARNGGFARALANWSATGNVAVLPLPDDSPLPPPPGEAGAVTGAGAAASWAATSVRRLPAFPSPPPLLPAPPGTNEGGVAVWSGAGVTSSLVQEYEELRARGFAGVVFDALARDESGRVVVRATLQGAEGNVTLQAERTLPAGNWTRLFLPLEAFSSEGALAPADIVSAPLRAVSFEVTPGPRGPRHEGTNFQEGDEVRLDTIRVYVAGADRLKAEAAVAGLYKATKSSVATLVARTPAQGLWGSAQATTDSLVQAATSAGSGILATGESLAYTSEQDVRQRLGQMFDGGPGVTVDFVREVVAVAGVETPLPAHVLEALNATVAAVLAPAEPFAPAPPAPPQGRTVVAGIVRVELNASDPLQRGVAAGLGPVRLELDGRPAPAVARGPLAWDLDVRGLAAGDHALAIVAEDRVGNPVRQERVLLVVPTTQVGMEATAAAVLRQAEQVPPDPKDIDVLVARLDNPEQLAMDLQALASAAAAPAAQLVLGGPNDVQQTRASLLLPDPTRVALRDDDEDSVVRIWMGTSRVEVTGDGSLRVTEGPLLDTGVGDPDDPSDPWLPPLRPVCEAALSSATCAALVAR